MAKILGVMLTVADIEVMTAFFCDVLSFEKISSTHLSSATCKNLYGVSGAAARFVILKLGKEYLYLIEFERRGESYPPIRSNDLLFQHIAIVVSDMERAHQKLKTAGIQGISSDHVTIPEWNKPAAGIMAYYFRSPEGHPLELIYFPSGKGKPCWQTSQNLFLGIDHTAIVIFDTEKSLQFYRDALGMTVFGESLNSGDTQEALSGVPGAKVKITGLGFHRTESMGFEFLHYLNPVDGRAAPEMNANDLGCTYTVIEVDDFSKLTKLELTKGSFSSHDVNREHSAMIGKDNDGHRIIFVKKE